MTTTVTSGTGAPHSTRFAPPLSEPLHQALHPAATGDGLSALGHGTSTVRVRNRPEIRTRTRRCRSVAGRVAWEKALECTDQVGRRAPRQSRTGSDARWSSFSLWPFWSSRYGFPAASSRSRTATVGINVIPTSSASGGVRFHGLPAVADRHVQQRAGGAYSNGLTIRRPAHPPRRAARRSSHQRSAPIVQAIADQYMYR